MVRLKRIETPKSYADIRKMLKELPKGSWFLDKTYACFWFIGSTQVMYLGMDSEYRSWLNGNSPAGDSIFPDDLRIKIGGVRTRHHYSTYGVLDEDCWDTVTHHLVKPSVLPQEQKDAFNELKKLLTEYKRTEEQTKMEFGVELELESDDYMGSGEERELASVSSLIDNVGTDGSVLNGVEIRFRHPSLRGWKLDEIGKVLDRAKEMGLKSEWGTAGMHIHISHKDIQKAIKKFSANLYEMENILYPIGCRTKKVGKTKYDRQYGIGKDLYRDQYCIFKTLEIRAWNATTDKKVFLTRIRIAKALVEFLLTDLPVSISEFFKWMSKARKADYKFLLNAENPHEYGLPKDLLLTMLK